MVSQGYNQQEGIDYEETFVPVTRLEAIRIFLAYAAYMGFIVHQMDVKSAFLKWKISEEVYVQQPPRFESSEFPNHVCKLNKSLYVLKQALRAWYEALLKFLIQHKFVREKYVKDLLKKYDIANSALVKCPMLPSNNLGPDESKVFVNETLYQANPNESHLVAVKRIFRKSTSGDCQILAGKLVCWSAKKQSFVAMSSAKAEYVTAAGCCAQVLCIKSQLADYDVLYDKYTSEADTATKSITFTLSHFDKPLSFDLDVFSFVIGLKCSEDFVSIPPKEIVKAGLATLGLINENDTSLSSSNLINSSPMKIKYFSPKLRVLMQYIVKCLGGMQGSHDQLNVNQQTIVYCLCWGLSVCIASILFSDRIAQLHPVIGKKETKSNIYYTRYFSFIMEHLLGEAYINDNLKTLKPYHITALSFKPILENETALTAHMCKVAELSLDPIKTLLPPSREVNANDAADKSSSRTSSSKWARDEPQKKQVTKTQPAEETVATANATQSLGASELAEDQVNQPQTANAEKMDDEDQIIFLGAEYDNIDHRVEEPGDSDLHSIPDDKMVLISRFGTNDSNIEGTEYTEPKSSDPLGHLRNEISSLTTQDMTTLMQNMVHLLESAKVFCKANVEGEKWEKANPDPKDPTDSYLEISVPAREEPQQINIASAEVAMAEAQGEKPPAQELLISEEAPLVIKQPSLVTEQVPLMSLALIVHNSKEKDSLFQTTSSEYSLTPPKDENKGKGISIEEEPMKLLMPLIEQEGSDPKMLNLHQFSVFGKKMTLEDAQAQLTKIKKLADLKSK
ncbi:retrovirus-related pol polyprotein from transposon TNT 1-94 [Tanacetum coccineum]